MCSGTRGPSTNSGRAELANCTSNEKPPAFCIEPHEFKHQSGTHRSVEFRVCGAVGEKKHWLDLRLYSVPMDECLDTIPDAIKLLVAAWNAAAMAGRAIRKGSDENRSHQIKNHRGLLEFDGGSVTVNPWSNCEGVSIMVHGKDLSLRNGRRISLGRNRRHHCGADCGEGGVMANA